MTIPKGQHYAWPPMWGILFNRWMERDVVFDETAEYDLGEDNNDVNKLFGFGYLNGGHHKDSARFGWNYNYSNGRVRLFAYCYVNGERIFRLLCEVLPHKKVRLRISETLSSDYWFSVHDGYNDWFELAFERIPFTHKKTWKYKLGCFFGGNNPAPHDITIKITKK